MCVLKTSKSVLGSPSLLFSECPGSSSGTKRPKYEANHSIHLVQRLTLDDIYLYNPILLHCNNREISTFFFEDLHASLIGEKRKLVSVRHTQLYRSNAPELTYTDICP